MPLPGQENEESFVFVLGVSIGISLYDFLLNLRTVRTMC